MNKIVRNSLLLFLVLIVIISIVLLVVHFLKKCDPKTEFTNDMKSIKLPNSISTLMKNMSNNLDKLISNVYNNNVNEIKNIYCNDNNKQVFQNIIKGKNMNSCFEQIILHDTVKTIQTIINSESNLHPGVAKDLVTFTVFLIVSKEKNVTVDKLCNMLACGNSKTIWQISKPPNQTLTNLTQDDLSQTILHGSQFISPVLLLKFLMSNNVSLNMNNLHGGFNNMVSNFMKDNVNDVLRKACFKTTISNASQNDILSILNSIAKELIKTILNQSSGNSGPGGSNPHNNKVPIVVPSGTHKHGKSNTLPGIIGPQIGPF